MLRFFGANSRAGKQRIVKLLVAFTLTVVSLGSVVALVIYADAHSSIASENQVNQAQRILLNLAAVGRSLDRVDLNSLLYRETGDEDYLRAAQAATVSINTTMQRVQKLVASRSPAAERARELSESATALESRLEEARPTRTPVREEVAHCRLLLNLLVDEEQSLLTEREQQAERSELYALARRTATIVIGAVLVLILFGFLMRDAIRRGQFEERLSDANERLRLTVERLEQQANESRLLIAARDEVALCLEVKQAEESTIRYLERLLPDTGGALYILSNSRQLLELEGRWGDGEAVPDTFAPEACCALRAGRTRWRLPEHSAVQCTHFAAPPPERYFCIPLVAHGETLGVLTIWFGEVESCLAAQAREDTIDSLAEMAAMAIAGLNLRHKLEIQSIRDGMTGLFNRSFMEVALERELHRAGRQSKQIAVMMLDIDNFKLFNDAYGHEAGDIVLREVAESLRAQVRAEDIVCRFGGEEFVIILPEIASAAALERAEILRKTVAELSLRYHGQPLRQVTVSIGVAIFPDTADSPETLLRRADIALYAAKHRGRNRVAQAENSPVV